MITFTLNEECYDQMRKGQVSVVYQNKVGQWTRRLRENGIEFGQGVSRVDAPEGTMAEFRLAFRFGRFPIYRAPIQFVDIGKCPIEGWRGTFYRIHVDSSRLAVVG